MVSNELASNFKIKTYFNTSTRLLLFLLINNYDEKSRKHNKELIHKVRVELKKIRFCIVLLSGYNSPMTEFKKKYKPFKKIFEKAGKARDEEIKGKLIKKYSGYKKLLNENSEKIKNKEKQFFSQNEKYSTIVKSSSAPILHLIDNLSPITTNDLYAYLTSELRFSLNEQTSEESLHPSRKILKTVRYSAELSPEIEETISEKIDIDTCNDLEAGIGKWHDKRLFKEWILKTQQKKLFSMRKLRKDIQKDLKAIRKLIPALWKK